MENKFGIPAIQQVGIVVRDVEATAERYWKDFGIGPWQVFTFGPGSKELRYHGEPCSFSLRIAMAQVGPLLIELLQPLSGPTPHKDFLDQHGEGLQHFGVFVEHLDEAAEQMKKMGYREVSSAFGIGANGDGGAIYFSTQDSIGTLLEIIEMPQQLSSPIERVIPDPSA